VRLGYWALLRGVSRRTEAWRDPPESTNLTEVIARDDRQNIKGV
jgi:hypothetical protein